METTRIDLYNLERKEKVENNLNLMSGATTILENKVISDKVKVDVLDSIADNVINAITEKEKINLNFVSIW